MPPADPPRWQVFSLPKGGHAEDEYEDAWAADPGRGRFAVADGASETSFAGRWAQLLTEAFVSGARPPDADDWLSGPRRGWSAEVMGLELPWYAEMKRDEGAFATLLGLRVRRPRTGRPGRWQAAAVGDSCVVRVRADGDLCSFPMRKAAEFGNQPRLLGSRDGAAPEPDRASGSLLPGDRLFLMTDALAQWFLEAHERGRRPWKLLAAVLSADRPDDAFAEWVEGLRRRDGLRNDDVTLLAVEPDSRPPEGRP